MRVVASRRTRFSWRTYFLGEGQFREFEAGSDQPLHIIANKGVEVAHYSKSFEADMVRNSDPFMTILPPTDQYSGNYTFTTPVTFFPSRQDYDHYLSVVIDEAASHGLTLNGNLLAHEDFAAIWRNVGLTNFTAMTLNISSGTHILTHMDPLQTFGAYIYGLKFQEAYGHALGQRVGTLDYVCTRTFVIIRDRFDNDCDGRSDEEVENGMDDDGDGLVDEDLDGELPTTPISTTSDHVTAMSTLAISTVDPKEEQIEKQAATADNPLATTQTSDRARIQANTDSRGSTIGGTDSGHNPKSNESTALQSDSGEVSSSPSLSETRTPCSTTQTPTVGPSTKTQDGTRPDGSGWNDPENSHNTITGSTARQYLVLDSFPHISTEPSVSDTETKTEGGNTAWPDSLGTLVQYDDNNRSFSPAFGSQADNDHARPSPSPHSPIIGAVNSTDDDGGHNYSTPHHDFSSSYPVSTRSSSHDNRTADSIPHTSGGSAAKHQTSDASDRMGHSNTWLVTTESIRSNKTTVNIRSRGSGGPGIHGEAHNATTDGNSKDNVRMNSTHTFDNFAATLKSVSSDNRFSTGAPAEATGYSLPDGQSDSDFSHTAPVALQSHTSPRGTKLHLKWWIHLLISLGLLILLLLLIVLVRKCHKKSRPNSVKAVITDASLLAANAHRADSRSITPPVATTSSASLLSLSLAEKINPTAGHQACEPSFQGFNIFPKSKQDRMKTPANVLESSALPDIVVSLPYAKHIKLKQLYPHNTVYVESTT